MLRYETGFATMRRPRVAQGDNRIQLAWHHAHEGPIDHGNVLWKRYLETDDCRDLYQRAIDVAVEELREGPRRRDVAIVRDRS